MAGTEKNACIILAAGKGTRMGGQLPKVLYPLNGKPMLFHVVDTAVKVVGDKIIVVVGYMSEDVIREVSSCFSNISFAFQPEQLGTAHAVKCAIPSLEAAATDVLILFGDVPLIKESTLKSLVSVHHKSGNDITMLTVIMDDPSGYGRIVMSDSGEFCRIVEERDADAIQLEIREINTGICIVKKDLLEKYIGKIGSSNSQKEFYFTDIVEIAYSEKRKTGRFQASDSFEASGINTAEQLEMIESHCIMNNKPLL